VEPPTIPSSLSIETRKRFNILDRECQAQHDMLDFGTICCACDVLDANTLLAPTIDDLTGLMVGKSHLEPSKRATLEDPSYSWENWDTPLSIASLNGQKFMSSSPSPIYRPSLQAVQLCYTLERLHCCT
jgi:hypothetical protein